jgi:hypothetical protein
MPLVSAVPFELLALPARTAAVERSLRRRASVLDAALVGAGPPAVAHAGLGAAALAHTVRARELTERAAGTGLALLLAGGAPGAAALLLHAGGRGVDHPAAVAVLAATLGLDPSAGAAVERPAVDPVAVAALAAALGGTALAEVARTHPHLVGPVDGMPLGLRSSANRRIALAAGGPFAALAADDRQLLYVDPVRGHAAEVLGDLRGAPHVAVVVPGMANGVDRFSTVLDKAEALRAAAAALDPPEHLATIAWLGYDSPLVDAVVDDEARTGGPHLARFVDGVVAGGAGGATLTVVGHSYGSVVTGFALRAGLDVDAVAVTGSPGMGAATAGDLGDVPVYALSAPLDLVSLTERYGTDPADPGFGATVLATGVAGHRSYFEPGTVALANLALVATGRADEAAQGGPSPFDTAVDTIEEVHRAVVEARVDAVQRGVLAAAGRVSSVVDAAETRLPAPMARVVDDAQDVAGAGLELAGATVDLVQRVTSPDVVLSLGGDAWELLSG